MLQSTLVLENLPNLLQKCDPDVAVNFNAKAIHQIYGKNISRFLISNSYYMLQSTLMLENSPNLWQM